MKLLEKSQLNTIKQAEQKSIIDSGISLARKIDVLRQELLDLEKRRADFIAGSRKELDDAIKELKNTKVNLEIEISDARIVLSKLREPLDEEWDKLHIAQADIAELNKKAEIYFREILQSKKELQEKSDLVDSHFETAFKQKNETEELLKKAADNEKRTAETLDRAQALEDKNEVKFYNEGLRLAEWERKLTVRENKLKEAQKEFNKEKKELETKKTRWKT